MSLWFKVGSFIFIIFLNIQNIVMLNFSCNFETFWRLQFILNDWFKENDDFKEYLNINNKIKLFLFWDVNYFVCRNLPYFTSYIPPFSKNKNPKTILKSTPKLDTFFQPEIVSLLAIYSYACRFYSRFFLSDCPVTFSVMAYSVMYIWS